MESTNHYFRPLGLIILFCLFPVWVLAQTVSVTGVVKDASGEPIIGASVVEAGTTNGIVTDLDGNFKLNVSAKGSLKISFIGYQTQTIPVAGKKQFDITLKEDAKVLDEVVVVGYGQMKRSDLTGSVVSVNDEAIKKSVVTSVDQVLQGRAAGVQVQANSGMPGGSSSIRIRGINSLNASNEPIFVIDGIIIDGSTGSGSDNALASINPSDIVSMDVLKDASATAIYGARAANGVVIVTTKKGVEGSKPTVNFNYNVTTDVQIKNFRILYGDEWRETVRRFAKETLVYDPSNQYALEILEPNSTALGSANTNWFDEVKQTAIRHNADLTVSGGSKVSKYLISLSIFDQQGMVKGGDLSRYNARVSTEMNVLPILRFGINANMSYTDQDNAGTSLFSAQGYRPDLYNSY